jgi:hypothetical protein
MSKLSAVSTLSMALGAGAACSEDRQQIMNEQAIRGMFTPIPARVKDLMRLHTSSTETAAEAGTTYNEAL